jgi:hypothetical protein
MGVKGSGGVGEGMMTLTGQKKRPPTTDSIFNTWCNEKSPIRKIFLNTQDLFFHKAALLNVWRTVEDDIDKVYIGVGV